MKTIIVFVFVLLYLQAFAQLKNSVTGTVKDDKGHAVLFATVGLLGKDSNVVKTAISNEKGSFKIEDISTGIYIIRVSEIGYQDFFSSQIIIDSAHTHEEFNDIVLLPSESALKGITITARKPFIEQKPDKLIINIENSLLATGNTSLELLGKLPGLLVSPDGNVTMKNKTVTVYINGRPTYLSGSDLAAYLNGLSADQIQKVELIANPSANFDAGGSGGIVNIILKKNQKFGWNGSVNSTYTQGRYPRFLESINLNYRYKKINIYGSFGYNLTKDFTNYTSTRIFKPGDTALSRFDQNGTIVNKNNTTPIRLGMDWSISPKTIAGFLINWNENNSHSKNENLTNVTGKSGSIDSSIRSISTGDTKWKTSSFNVNFKHTFDSTGRELTFDGDYVIYHRSDFTFYQNNYLNNAGTLLRKPDTLLNNYPGSLQISSLKTDYVYPLGHKTTVQAGIKTSWVDNKNNLEFSNQVNGRQVLNTGLTNNFIYNENVYAAYINVNKEYNNLSIEIGLRGEETKTLFNQVTSNQTISNSYFELFPSAFATYKIGEKSQLGISFTRRINRPAYQRLNPYKKIYDPLNYEEGNPYLQPSFSNTYELDYTYNNKLFLSVFYDYENKTATNVILQNQATKTTITTFGNLAKATDGGITLTYSDQLFKWLNSNNFFGLFFNRFQGPYLNGYLDVFKPTFNVNSVNTFTISKTVRAELGINYLSGQQQGLLNIENIGWQINPGIQKSFINNRGSIKLSVTDLFNQRTWKYSTRFQEIDTRYESKRDARRISLAAVWRFGKQSVKQERKRRTGVDDEKSRAE